MLLWYALGIVKLQARRSYYQRCVSIIISRKSRSVGSRVGLTKTKKKQPRGEDCGLLFVACWHPTGICGWPTMTQIFASRPSWKIKSYIQYVTAGDSVALSNQKWFMQERVLLNTFQNQNHLRVPTCALDPELQSMELTIIQNGVCTMVHVVFFEK